MKPDLVIHNCTALTVNSGFDIIENAVITIKNGMILSVSEADKADMSLYDAEITDAEGGIVMPGLVNTHSHLPMTLFRGLADDMPLMTWLNDHIFPAEAEMINAESARAGALLGCAEMLLSGTTSCCDGYFHEDSVAMAMFESGIRGIAAHGIIDYPAPGVPDPLKNIETASLFAEKWLGVDTLIKPAFFCHSPYTCSSETIIKAKKEADRLGLKFFIHVSETREEVESMRSEKGLSPVQYLDSLGVLDENTVAVHCIWVDDDDIEILSAKKVSVSHAPESNMKLGSGTAPVHKMIMKGIRAGLGTDGCASNNDLDMIGEMGTAARLQKVFMHDPAVMSAEAVIKMATIRGAELMGVGHITGSIEHGKAADIIIISTDRVHMRPLYHPASQVVYSARGSDVRHVFVNGRHIVKDFKLLTLDLNVIMAAVDRIACNKGIKRLSGR